MNDALFTDERRTRSVPERLVVFGFFTWGALIAAFLPVSLPQLPPERMLLSLLLLSLPMFGSSGFGWLLLPIAMLAFGLYSETNVLQWYLGRGESALIQFSPLIFRLLLTPAVLLAGIYALSASGALRAAVQRASPSAKNEYQRSLCLAVFFALLGLSCVFYFM